MRYTHGIWHGIICLLLGMGLVCGGTAHVTAQDAVTPQGNRAVASLAIVNVQGDAEILSKVELERSRGEARIMADAWKPAAPKTTLSPGDQLRTGGRGTLQLQLNDGTLMTLAGDTTVMVEELRSARGESPQLTQIKLEQGKISTQQTTKILGQTNQIIRTDNGSVNTRLGEVEIWRPSQEMPRLAMLGSFPLLAQKAPRDETFVNLRRGGATVDASGVGRVVARSDSVPETCIDVDGLQFILSDPKQSVNFTKLEDEDAYMLTSKQQFYVMVATGGTASVVDIVTLDSEAVVDIEGFEVAEQDKQALSRVRLHPLLTVGVKTFAVKLKLNCDDTESRGLNEFSIQALSGNVNVTSTGFGSDTQLQPSRGLFSVIPTPTPSGPTPPPTRPDGDEEGGPGPTPTPEEPGQPRPIPPTPIPVTHTHPRAPIITQLFVQPAIPNSPSCASHISNSAYHISFVVAYQNYLPSMMGGMMTFRIADNAGGYSPNYYRIPDDVLTLTYQYPVGGNPIFGIQQMEIGSFQGHFCYIPPVGTELNVTVELQDLEGNSTGFMNCHVPDIMTGQACYP